MVKWVRRLFKWQLSNFVRWWIQLGFTCSCQLYGGGLFSRSQKSEGKGKVVFSPFRMWVSWAFALASFGQTWWQFFVCCCSLRSNLMTIFFFSLCLSYWYTGWKKWWLVKNVCTLGRWGEERLVSVWRHSDVSWRQHGADLIWTAREEKPSDLKEDNFKSACSLYVICDSVLQWRGFTACCTRWIWHRLLYTLNLAILCSLHHKTCFDLAKISCSPSPPFTHTSPSSPFTHTRAHTHTWQLLQKAQAYHVHVQPFRLDGHVRGMT